MDNKLKNASLKSILVAVKNALFFKKTEGLSKVDQIAQIVSGIFLWGIVAAIVYLICC